MCVIYIKSIKRCDVCIAEVLEFLGIRQMWPKRILGDASELESFINRPTPSSAIDLNISGQKKEEFTNEINKLKEHTSINQINSLIINKFSNDIGLSGNGYDFDFNGIKCINTLSIEDNTQVSIKNAHIGQMNIIISQKIHLDNCLIKQITVQNSPKGSLGVENCRIGKIEIQKNAINSLTLYNTIILRFICPEPGIESPFTGGSIKFDKLHMPYSKDHSKEFTTSQDFTNLRTHLESLQNSSATSLIRSYEMRSLRPSERPISKAVSTFNWITSDYGRQPERALFLIMLMMIFTIFILTYYHGTAVSFCNGVPSFNTTENLPEYISGDTLTGRLSRSIILGIRSFNPFTLFDSRLRIVPINQYYAMLLFINSLVCDLLLAVIIIAVRRKMRIHS